MAMSLAACFRLCSEHWASASVFVRSTRSSAWSTFVIVSAGYHQLLTFFNKKYFLSLYLLMFVKYSLGRL